MHQNTQLILIDASLTFIALDSLAAECQHLQGMFSQQPTATQHAQQAGLSEDSATKSIACKIL